MSTFGQNAARMDIVLHTKTLVRSEKSRNSFVPQNGAGMYPGRDVMGNFYTLYIPLVRVKRPIGERICIPRLTTVMG